VLYWVLALDLLEGQQPETSRLKFPPSRL